MNSTYTVPSIALNNGIAIPASGLGVYQIPKGLPTQAAVRSALELGYRHIDTASFYGNETDVGIAITASEIPREDIFVTTKLWITSYLFAESAFRSSLQKLGTDYIDLYLIHWPAPGKAYAWRVLEKLLKTGLVKAIGVSNYSIDQLETLLKTANIVPAVNQVEFSPFLYQKELLEYCASKGIAVEAYSPLTRGKRLNDTTIEEIAKTYHKTSAQIMLRWSIQHGLIILPKTTKPERMRENMDIFDFELSVVDMAKLDALNENYRALFK